MSTYRITWRDEKGRKHRTRRWHVEFQDHLGRRQRVPGFKDEKASVELERKIVKLVALRASDATPDEAMRRWIEGLAPDLRDRVAQRDWLVSPRHAATATAPSCTTRCCCATTPATNAPAVVSSV